MMKKILLTICCAFSIILSYAQGAGQSAETVWEAYQAAPSKMYTFIDGITNSDSPKDFIPYVQRFVNANIKRGVDWDVLYDELKETILPKDPDVATYFGVSLAQNTESYSNMIKALDVLPKTHTFDNDFIEDAVIYPDGRIVIVINGDESKLKYGRLIYTLFEKNKEPNIISQFKTNYQVLLYQPEGNSMLGIFKYAGTKDDYSFTPKTAKENDKLELYVGIYLNKNGEKVGEKCIQYDSFAQAYNAEVKAGQIAEKKIKNAARNKHAQMEKVLVQKYGRKAFDAMEDFRPYIGMPEGIVREYKLVMKDVNFIAYGFVRVENGYKVYLPTRLFAMTASYINARFPRAIYTKNGKVAAIKW